MKVLVLGSKGQLGKCLLDQLIKTSYEVIYLSRSDFDIGDLKSLSENMLLLKPAIVINASAYTAVDNAENDHKLVNLINHLAVAELANICKILNAWLIHISTDYVFDGKAVRPYREDDNTNPNSKYGESKLDGEIAITRSDCNYIIIRTSWIFSEYGSNFLKTMLILGAEHDELSIVSDQIGCPTYAQDIAKAIVCILPTLSSKRLASGIFHYCGDHSCSWHEFATLIFLEAKAKGYQVPTSIKKVSSLEFKSLAPRPSYSVLNCSKIKAEFDISQSNWINGIAYSLERLKEESPSKRL